MYIHSCIHRRSCMQRNVQICMHLPTHTHTPLVLCRRLGPVHISLEQGRLVHPSSAYLHMHTLAVTFSHMIIPRRTYRLAYHHHHHQRTPRRFGGPSPTVPSPLFQGFSHLPIPVYVSPSSRGKQMSPRAVLCFSSDWV